MPNVSSFTRATSSSMAAGTSYTLFSSSSACLNRYSAARAWLAKLMSITLAGCPSAQARFTRRPSASTVTVRPSDRVYSSTSGLSSSTFTACSRSHFMLISESKCPELQMMAPSFMFLKAGSSMTLQSPVTVTHTSAKRAASAAFITR